MKNISKTCIGYKDKHNVCNNSRITSSNPYCKSCAGKAFEDEVANLFKIQGYYVDQNIQCNGTQIDIFAQLSYGMAGIGIIIECKYKFDKTTIVDTSDVRSFAGTRDVFNNTTKGQKATQAFLVTSGKITPEARQVGNSLNVEIFTYTEMLNKIINFEPYLRYIISKYENSTLSDYFIDIQTSNGYSAMEEINDFINFDSNEGLLILGDYGSGKSSLVMKLCNDLAKNVLSGKSDPIPLLIELKEYSKAFNMEQLITNLFINTYKIPNANFTTLLELINHGKLLLVFDGYDEAAQRVDNTVKHQIFSEIIKFASINSKVIVTCRRNFFNQRQEFDLLVKDLYLHVDQSKRNVYFEEVELSELSSDQIIEFLESKSDYLMEKDMTVAKMIKIMNNTHDLMDLAKRPVLLQVIVDTISDSDISEEDWKVNAASLYKKYTGFWLMREDLKGKTLIKSSEKILFTRKLAIKMYNNSMSSIHYSLIPEEIVCYFKELKLQDDIDHFSHDIKSCSFLNRNDDGEYSFIHKSFMEYFTAHELLSGISNCFKLKGAKLMKELNALLCGNLINQEVSLFIYDLIESKEYDKHSIKSVITNIDLKALDVIAYKNAISVLSKVSDDISVFIDDESNLSYVDFSKSKFGDKKLTKVNFSNASFYKSNFHNTHFSNCNFENANFRNFKGANIQMDNCQLPYSDFTDSMINHSILKKTSFVSGKFEKTMFLNCKAIYCDFSGVIIDENTKIEIGDKTDTCVGLPY